MSGRRVLLPETKVLGDPVADFAVVREGILFADAEALQSDEVDILLESGPDHSSYLPLEAHLFEVGHVCIDGDAEVDAGLP